MSSSPWLVKSLYTNSAHCISFSHQGWEQHWARALNKILGNSLVCSFSKTAVVGSLPRAYYFPSHRLLDKFTAPHMYSLLWNERSNPKFKSERSWLSPKDSHATIAWATPEIVSLNVNWRFVTRRGAFSYHLSTVCTFTDNTVHTVVAGRRWPSSC